MTNGVEKLKSSISGAPLGALTGAVIGYVMAKTTGYEKTASVVGFIMVGIITGSFIGSKIKTKI